MKENTLIKTISLGIEMEDIVQKCLDNEKYFKELHNTLNLLFVSQLVDINEEGIINTDLKSIKVTDRTIYTYWFVGKEKDILQSIRFTLTFMGIIKEAPKE